MNINAHCRALQHLLVQGFVLYTCPAAVCTRLYAPEVLASHSWAATLDAASGRWCESLLLERDPWRAAFLDAAAQAAASRQPVVLCHHRGVLLALPLDVTPVRHAWARLEVAANLGVPPTPIEGLVAVPDAILEQELRRRQREAEAAAAAAQPAPTDEAPVTVRATR